MDFAVYHTTLTRRTNSFAAKIRNCVGFRDSSIATGTSTLFAFINLDINPNFRFDFKVENAPTQQRLQSVGEETKA